MADSVLLLFSGFSGFASNGESHLHDSRFRRVLSEFPTLIQQFLESGGSLNERYCRDDDGILFVVKSNSLPDCIEEADIENELENLINAVHPCIAAPIGFVFLDESVPSREMKIVRLYIELGSLAEVISKNPGWWTATAKAKAKAKAVVGLVIGLRFLHSLGLVHGHLKSSNIHFDVDHHIQIGGFGSIDL
jgi:serine/threonine protein kinase